MKIFRHIRNLLLASLLLCGVAAAQGFNTAPFNTTTFNGSSTSIPLAQFTTVQPGQSLNVLGFHQGDTLYYGFTSTGTDRTAAGSASLEIKSDFGGTTLVSLAIDTNGTSDGLITNAGASGSLALYFIIPTSSLSAGTAYVYNLKSTDTAGHLTTWTGLLRLR